MNTIGNPIVSPALSQSVRGLPAMPSPAGGAAGAGEAGSFKNFLLDSIQDVNAMQQQADTAVESLMTGGDADPAAVLTAVQKADMAFRMMLQMRNKAMQAYQEIKDIRI
ncbi:flagellar hook-basal body complex protein FliE [Adhaeretor mobilis]|uniref:Flagellar hook-basal body complex protein FliE n=1 Tax=Adhaeretor mobilis TaxID=1930276 RepID=A0A517MYU7_9BACT|nr:flagellar hook-basal body complex protein FliE [Adhaeretor mobilis]QDT00055.1 flagellar hook-basal body protein FliE [Adhaeretor mobilis]